MGVALTMVMMLRQKEVDGFKSFFGGKSTSLGDEMEGEGGVQNNS